MTEKKSGGFGLNLLIYLVAAAPLIAFWMVYDRLPEQMATHFGVSGEPDDWTDKRSFFYLFAGVQLGVPLLMQISRRIDPRRENYRKFERAFNIVRLAVAAVLSGLMGLVLVYNLGYDVDIQMYVLLGVGMLFLVLGNVTTQFRYNYFMGYRTPWTLADEEVWRRTHRLAGPLIMAAGAVAMIAAFLPGLFAVWLFGAAAAVAFLVPSVYSYVMFRKMQKSV